MSDVSPFQSERLVQLSDQIAFAGLVDSALDRQAGQHRS
jgi:hypothetical protein